MEFLASQSLLVLGIAVPTLSSPSDEELRRALLHAGAALLPYVTSFATIGVIWLNHHRMFTCVQRVDHATLTLNLLVLFVVAFLPYPTAVLGRFGAMPSSVFLYGSTMPLLGISYSLLARHIQRKELTVSGNIVRFSTCAGKT